MQRNPRSESAMTHHSIFRCGWFLTIVLLAGLLPSLFRGCPTRGAEESSPGSLVNQAYNEPVGTITAFCPTTSNCMAVGNTGLSRRRHHYLAGRWFDLDQLYGERRSLRCRMQLS